MGAKFLPLIATVLVSLRACNGLPVDLTLLQCPNESWTFHNSLCYFPAVDFVSSQDHARKQCFDMDSDLATITIGDSTVFSLAIDGVIHPDSRFWVEDPDEGTTNCTFVGLTFSGDTEYGTAPCDTQGFSYICVAEPDSVRQHINQPPMLMTDSPVNVLAAPSWTDMTVNVSSTPSMQDTRTKRNLQMGENNLVIQEGSPVITATVTSTPDSTGEVLAVGPPVLTAAMSAVSINVSCSAPWFMSPTKGSCYYVAPLFAAGNFFETSAFCMSLDGWMVEPSDGAEFAALHDIVAHHADWTDGPWIGMMRPSNDSRVVYLSSQRAPADTDYQTRLAAELQPSNATTSGLNCVGFSVDGDFGLWDCRAIGNPFCEKDLEYIVTVKDDASPNNASLVMS
ncbi:hypothetical protein BV898_09031 [Hypsibius exemplaris]|uniref:C-type lectin domain-containing protein n=1 Tax=Hypsibius exemplaris TaxID=2072580 RepID=A0A1W0WNV3_HYPEX|nr:hypothetical protein BV898_09031 [Hypsibius exemplaris]